MIARQMRDHVGTCVYSDREIIAGIDGHRHPNIDGFRPIHQSDQQCRVDAIISKQRGVRAIGGMVGPSIMMHSTIKVPLATIAGQ